MATVYIEYAEIGPFPRKNNKKQKCFLCVRAPIPFAPLRRAQIDAAQQRA